MSAGAKPSIYSIAAHRGFADALVAGLVPRYADESIGLARLTLLVPSSRAARTISQAFIRHLGERGEAGMLMPRMAVVGDLDLDEALGPLLDPLAGSSGAEAIPPAAEPTRRWLELAELIALERAQLGLDPLPGAARLRLAQELARTMDRLLVEDIAPEQLLGEPVLQELRDLSEHWKQSLRLFARVQERWRALLDERGEVDAATRRNRLFDRAARSWRSDPPPFPIVAAGVTSAAPALARLLRIIAGLPDGAVILPDLDLTLSDEAWEELGQAGASDTPGGKVLAANDALTHPQYHLKLLLHRMGISREEVQPWHRRGMAAGSWRRSHAISALFLPPQASRSWINLTPQQRSLSGVRLMSNATIEEEAQAIALLVREALEQPEKRVAVVTADRALARRISQQLARWNIRADDSAGQALSLTAAGRLAGLLGGIMSGAAGPVEVIGLLSHPLIASQDEDARREWLSALRRFDQALRGQTLAPGLASFAQVARRAGVSEWWAGVADILEPLACKDETIALADAIDRVVAAAQGLAGDAAWSREDGRALATLLEDLRRHARDVKTRITPRDVAPALRDAMDAVAVRPPYGGHSRIAIYGLLESRMARADLVICAGLTEGSWPQAPAVDALLAPGVLRVLGVPGAEFRIGLAAHDLASAMGAPEVVLSHSLRDAEGPTLPSRFVLRVEALLGELARNYRETTIPALVPALDRAPDPLPPCPRPRPMPSARHRQVDIGVTALDRLLGDPYQFYAQYILRLRPLDPLAPDPFADPALRGTLVHQILEDWHKARESDPDLALVPFAEAGFAAARVHPLFRGLWQPRLIAAFERFEEWVDEAAGEGRQVIASEAKGEMRVRGITIRGRADRIDRMEDGSLAIVDYKTGSPPTADQVGQGFALQMGLLGLIARDGAFSAGERLISGEAGKFEYWSAARKNGGFGYKDEPMKVGNKRKGVAPEEFLPLHEDYLARAIDKYLVGTEPFTARENPDYPGYSNYDQLMRLQEWIVTLGEDAAAGGDGQA